MSFFSQVVRSCNQKIEEKLDTSLSMLQLFSYLFSKFPPLNISSNRTYDSSSDNQCTLEYSSAENF